MLYIKLLEQPDEQSYCTILITLQDLRNDNSNNVAVNELVKIITLQYSIKYASSVTIVHT